MEHGVGLLVRLLLKYQVIAVEMLKIAKKLAVLLQGCTPNLCTGSKKR
jgi:hypothetical protein